MGIKINLERGHLLGALSGLQSVTGKKGTIAILSNVLLETEESSISLTATDLEIGLKINVPAEILSPGSITLPAKKILEIVREAASSTIHIEEKDNNWIKIEEGSSHYNLAGMGADEYPSFPSFTEDGFGAIPSEILADLIEKTIVSVASEGESQFNLTGALLEKEEKDGNSFLRMVSSDGHRLSLMERKLPTEISFSLEKKIIIPKKGLLEIRKIAEANDSVSFNIEEKQAVFKTEDTLLIIRLLNGDFPDYRNIINIINEDNSISVNRIDLMNSMKRMNLFTEDRFNVVNLKIDKNIITLFSQSADIGNAKDELSVSYNGEMLSLYFNGRYFIDSLQVLTCENVNMYISSDRSPCFIKSSEEEGFLSVIMPMKL